MVTPCSPALRHGARNLKNLGPPSDAFVKMTSLLKTLEDCVTAFHWAVPASPVRASKT